MVDVAGGALKTNQMHRIPLTGTALEILNRRKAAADESLYVFPGNRVKQPLRYIGKRHAEIVEGLRLRVPAARPTSNGWHLGRFNRGGTVHRCAVARAR